MRYLLDTHAFIWWLEDYKRLGQAARAVMADPRNEVFVSVASIWELVIKLRVGKLDVQIEVVERALARSRLLRLHIQASHLATLAGLPRHHRDPFDHMLIAQAIAEDAVLLSVDRRMAAYPVRIQSCS